MSYNFYWYYYRDVCGLPDWKAKKWATQRQLADNLENKKESYNGRTRQESD